MYTCNLLNFKSYYLITLWHRLETYAKVKLFPADVKIVTQVPFGFISPKGGRLVRIS